MISCSAKPSFPKTIWSISWNIFIILFYRPKGNRRYIRYLPFGLLASLIPFFAALPYTKKEEALSSLLYALMFGSIIIIMIWVVFISVYAVLTILHIKTGFHFQPSLFFNFVLSFTGMCSGTWIIMILRNQLLGEQLRFIYFFPAIILGGFIGTFIHLHSSYRRAKEDALALRAAAAESRYNALEHQMRPHFLFNALNSLAELIESKHESAAEMTYLLSDLYRQILANSKVKTAPLASELDIVRRYLELEKLRFGSRLNYSINLNEEEVEKLYLPSLMLQTLVENAVKHGIAKAVNGGAIDIAISRTAKPLYQLKVTNSGAPSIPQQQSGTGLENTRARLELLYPDKHQFRIAADGDRIVASFYFTGEKID